MYQYVVIERAYFSEKRRFEGEIFTVEEAFKNLPSWARPFNDKAKKALNKDDKKMFEAEEQSATEKEAEAAIAAHNADAKTKPKKTSTPKTKPAVADDAVGVTANPEKADSASDLPVV